MDVLAVTAPSARARLPPGSARLLRAASDERLVALTRAGVMAAFEALYDRHHRQLLSFCRHMLGSREEAEDAVQHTFLSAHAALARSDGAIHLRPWLYTIARNRCLSMLRARREPAAGDAAELATAGLAEQVQQREELRELLADVEALPEDQRAALVLAELGALGHEEIAEVLGVARVKVKALVFQARESLIATRRAREADCREIREQLATLTGGALRRASLRRHLAVCDGCRDYRAEVARQRKALALLLPVAPTAALKHGALPAGMTGGGALAGGAAAKLAVAAAVAVTATGGTVAVVRHEAPATAGAAPSASRSAPVATAPRPLPAGAARAARPAHTAASGPASRRHPAAARSHRRTRPATVPADGSRALSPGSSASAPSRAGASPSHANPTPGVPRGKALGRTTPPGHARGGRPPGQSRRTAPPASPPGQSRGGGPPATPPGQSRGGGPPGQPQAPAIPAAPSAAPGNSASAPGHGKR